MNKQESRFIDNDCSPNTKIKKNQSVIQATKTKIIENLNTQEEQVEEQWCNSPNLSSKHSRSRSMDLSMAFGGNLAQKEADMVADILAKQEKN